MKLFKVLLIPLLYCLVLDFISNSVVNANQDITTKTTNAPTTTEALDHEENPVTLSNWGKIKAGVKGLWRDFYTEHFVKKYQKLEDLFSNTKKDLIHKVSDTEEYISHVTKRQRELLKAVGNETKESAKSVLVKLNAWTDDLANFKERIANSAKSEYENLTEQWRKSISHKWNNGLEKIVEITRKAELSTGEDRNQPILIESLEGGDKNHIKNTTVSINSGQNSSSATKPNKIDVTLQPKKNATIEIKEVNIGRNSSIAKSKRIDVNQQKKNVTVEINRGHNSSDIISKPIKIDVTQKKKNSTLV